MSKKSGGKLKRGPVVARGPTATPLSTAADNVKRRMKQVKGVGRHAYRDYDPKTGRKRAT